MVDNALLTGSLSKILTNAANADAVLDPELTDLFVSIGQRTALALGMREISIVEVQTNALLYCPVSPLCKVLGSSSLRSTHSSVST